MIRNHDDLRWIILIYSLRLSYDFLYCCLLLVFVIYPIINNHVSQMRATCSFQKKMIYLTDTVISRLGSEVQNPVFVDGEDKKS